MQLKTRISDSVVKKDLPLMAATENSFKMTNCNNISTKNNKKMYSWKKEKISQEAIIKYDATAQEYHCKACTYRSNQKGNIWTHFKSIHLRDRPYMCDLCPFAASQKINLETHIKSAHLRLRPFKCKECTFAATQKGNLQTHERVVHSVKRRFNVEDMR